MDSMTLSGMDEQDPVPEPYEIFERQKDKTVDIITKATLPPLGSPISIRTCTRCRGLAEKRQLDVSDTDVNGIPVLDRRWKSWLRRWEERCFCGGLWATKSTAC